MSGAAAGVLPVRLPVRLVEKPWGRDDLPAPFTGVGAGARIGEIWFEPSPVLPDLLIKYIFTSDKLSVQVHPNDAQAMAAGLGRAGKEECWLVLAAEPGACLGIGFDGPISAEEMRAAALDGSIEARLVWHKVRAGDFFYIPANTVHAIGAGVTVIEVQQTSDITYRLYDYGRPRELHLDAGIAVALGQPYDLARWHRHVDLAAGGARQLVAGPHFTLDVVYGAAARAADGPVLVIPLAGEVRVGGQLVAPGACALGLPGQWTLGDGGVCLIAGACA